MAGRAAGQPPKIIELVELHKKHPAAFEATLIEHGLRWRDVATRQFTWSDCYALMSTQPFDAPINKAINGKDWWWYHPVVDHIVGIFDALGVIAAILNQRPNVKKSQIPKPTLRPWDTTKEKEVLKVKPSPLSAMRKMLGWD